MRYYSYLECVCLLVYLFIHGEILKSELTVDTATP